MCRMKTTKMSNPRSSSSRYKVVTTVSLLLAWMLSIRIAYHQGQDQQMLQNEETKKKSFKKKKNGPMTTTTAATRSADENGVSSSLSSSSFSLALEQTYGYFDDIPNDDWKIRQQLAREHVHYRHKASSSNDFIPAGMFFFNNYEPLFSCPHRQRVGGLGDGPKWMCDPHRIATRSNREKYLGPSKSTSSSSCLIYSIGCAGIYKWEEGLIKLLRKRNFTCEFHIFDPGNYDRPKNTQRWNIHYHQWAISSSYYDQSFSRFNKNQGKALENITFKTFPETMRLLGHEGRTIDVLKADCEYCEWFVYQDWIKYGNVQQFLVETHNIPLPNTVEGAWPWPGLSNITVYDFFDDLQRAGYIMFSKEPNIHPVNKGNMLEWSFIKFHPDFLYGS